MPATLAISDDADGTGGVATITESGAVTNSLYAQAVNGELGTSAWTLIDTRSGNGTIPIASPDPTAIGFYWWKVESSEGASNLVYQPITSGTEAVYERILDAVAARITLLGLTDQTSRALGVYPRMLPDDDTVVFPCVMATLDGVSESDVSQVMSKDDLQYPVRVSIIDKNPSRDNSRREMYLRWREKIARSFRGGQRLPGVPEVMNSSVQYGQVFDPKLPEYQFLVMQLSLVFTTREVRGFGT